MQVRINNEILSVPEYFKVKGNTLYNSNIKRYEGADGDIVRITINGKTVVGHVKGYTNYQFIPTYEFPTRVLSAQELHDGTCKVEFEHNTPVFEIKQDNVQ